MTSRVLFICALIVGGLAGCSRSTPCAKLAKAICDGGDRDACQAFVTAEMVSGDGPLTGEQTQAACAIVLEDEATVKAMARARASGR